MSLSPTTTSDEEQQQEPTYMWMGDDIEDLERYTKGGYHPVNIDDEIYGRYRIVHKLGFGSYSTVWLARDQQLDRFVSLKFLVADTPPNSPEILILRQLSNISGSQLENHPGRPFVLTLLDEFEVQGENGRHHCLVTEALGPSISAVKYESDRNRLPGHISRIVATQCAKGLAYLHSCGVVHGDLHKGNILFKIAGLDSWTTEQVYESFGEPRKKEIHRTDGQPATSAAPKYAVGVPNPIKLMKFCFTDACSVQIADFGEALPPACEKMVKDLNTPVGIAAPEILFEDGMVRLPVDIWALACTLYEILSDTRLLQSFFADRDEIVAEMVSALGKLPDRWWHKWENRSRYFEEDGAFKPDTEVTEISLKERVERLNQGRDGPVQHGFDAQELSALKQMFVRMLRYEPAERIQIEEILRLLPASWENVLPAEPGKHEGQEGGA